MLRDYQIDLIQQARVKIRNGERRLIVVLPTGGGKTFTFTSMIKTANERHKKCLILTDRIELMKQAGGALNKFDLNPIEIKAGSKPYLGGYMYVAMVETISRRLGQKNYQHFLSQIDIIIIDECHMRSFDKLFPYISPETKVLGFTATPRRMGNKNLLSNYYNDIVIGTDIPTLVENGFLAKPEYFGVQADLEGVKTVRGDYDANEVAARFSESKLYSGVVKNWETLAKGTKTIVFSSNIESSKEVVREFVSKGYKAKHLDSTMGAERYEILKWFSDTPDGILSNVGILTKGFDEPSIRTVILYRATKSLPLYLQMVGRGSRVIGSKTSFNVLDFGNNIVTHGFWHDQRDWKLKETDDTRARKVQDAVLKNCDGCEAFIPVATVTCKHCGHVHEKEKKEQEFRELQKLSPSELRTKALNGTIEEMAEMAKLKLVKPFYVLHNLEHYKDVKTFVKRMGWSPYWFQHNHSRFWWSREYLKEMESGYTQIKIAG